MNRAGIPAFNNGDGSGHSQEKYLNINNSVEDLVIREDDDSDNDNEHWQWHHQLQQGKPQTVQLLESDNGNSCTRVTVPLNEFPVFNGPFPKRNGVQVGGEDFQRYLGNKKETMTLTSTFSNLKIPNKHVENINICRLCGQGFYNNASLGRHINMVHGVIVPQTEIELQRPQQLKFKPQSTSEIQGGGVQEGLTLPVMRQQDEQKIIRDGYHGEEPCFLCGLVFSTASQLMMHEKVHASTASFNEPELVQVGDEYEEADDPVNDEEFRNNVVNLVGFENVDDDDVGHIEDVQVQPIEMNSNDIEIPLSECPVSEPPFDFTCGKCHQYFWDYETLEGHCAKEHLEQKKLETLGRFGANHGHRPGRPVVEPESLPLNSKSQANAKEVLSASATLPGFEQKMTPRNDDRTVKVQSPPAMVRQDGVKFCITQCHDESQGKRDSRLRQNPKRKIFDEYDYESHLTKVHPWEAKKKPVKSDPKLNSNDGKQTRGHPKMDLEPRSFPLEHLNR